MATYTAPFKLLCFILLFTTQPLLAIGAENTDRPLFWKVSTTSATAYLLGSIHFGKPDMY